jgi:hypothetical protein
MLSLSERLACCQQAASPDWELQQALMMLLLGHRLQILKATEAATQAAALQLLNTACDTDTALEQIPDPVLGATLDLTGSPHHAAALAALDLSYSASICSTVRNRLCAQLVKTPRQQQQGAGSMHSCERLASLWDICCRAAAGVAASDDSTQVSCLHQVLGMQQCCKLSPQIC